MARGNRVADSVFEAAEALYRRIDPDDIEMYAPGKYRVTPGGWTDVVEMSVVRGKYAIADHARWQSATDPLNAEGFQAQLFRDWPVAKILRGDLPNSLPGEGAVVFTFDPVHVPFDDLYAHAEVHTKRDGVRIEDSSKFHKKAKSQYRAILSSKAVVVLKAGEVEETPDAPGDDVPSNVPAAP